MQHFTGADPFPFHFWKEIKKTNIPSWGGIRDNFESFCEHPALKYGIIVNYTFGNYLFPSIFNCNTLLDYLKIYLYIYEGHDWLLIYVIVFFLSLFSSCLPACPRFVLLTGNLKLSAATDNSLRAGLDEATGKLSVRMREQMPLVSGTHVGFSCTHAPHTAAYLHGRVSRCTLMIAPCVS